MYEQTWRDNQKVQRGWAGNLAGAFGVALLTAVMLHSCAASTVKTAEISTLQLTSQQEAYKKFFLKHGSESADALAIAVSQTKHPRLMAAIAVKESNGNPKAVGDSGRSVGAFQVQPAHWGRVSTNPLEQAIQAEKILDELLVASRGRLRYALAVYNGGAKPNRRAYGYADHVLRLTNTI